MLEKEIKTINETKNLLKLDLSNKIVLTEIGTGPFSFVGLVAAMSNSPKVILWTRDSRYGMGQNNINLFKSYISKLNIDTEFIFRLNQRPISDIFESDIITNLGFIRPIDESFLSNMNDKAVISYMAEAWEFRESDVNLALCQEKDIKIAGVWENHPDLQIFDKCGLLAHRMLESIDFNLDNKSVAIISDDKFGIVINSHFKSNSNAKINLISTDNTSSLNIEDFDLVFIADYLSQKKMIGEGGKLKINKYSNTLIVHLAGIVDEHYATNPLYNIFPRVEGDHHKMTYNLGYLGNEVVIKLHSAGLKVGELLHNNIKSELVQEMVL